MEEQGCAGVIVGALLEIETVGKGRHTLRRRPRIDLLEQPADMGKTVPGFLPHQVLQAAAPAP